MDETLSECFEEVWDELYVDTLLSDIEHSGITVFLTKKEAEQRLLYKGDWKQNDKFWKIQG